MPGFAASRPLLLVLLLSLASAPSAGATQVYAGTMGSPSGHGRVLRYQGGLDWQDITPPLPAGVRVIWDLEWHDGALWVAGSSGGSGFIGRFDGGWTTWQGSFGTAVTSLAIVEGRLYAAGLFPGPHVFDGTFWLRIGEVRNVGRAASGSCDDGPPHLFLGDNTFDTFWVYDPAGGLACTQTCGTESAGNLCAAGCHGGSCVHSMVWHDAPDLGPTAWAGAYAGRMYYWVPAARTFVLNPRGAGGHVQALASFRGSLMIGTSVGTLESRGNGLDITVDHEFANDEPISALAVDEGADLLWIGHGGVPFGLARANGTSMVRTWDGTNLVDRGLLGEFDAGVPALLVVDDGIAGCDAGPPQVVECSFPTTPVILTAAVGLACTEVTPTTTWTGDFLEGQVTGGVVTVHYAGTGTHDVTLSLGVGGPTCTTQVVVRDTIPPALTIPPDIEVPCPVEPPLAPASATDSCDGAAAVEVVNVTTPGPCSGTFSLERHFTAADAAGNEVTRMQRIDVVDLTAPVLSGVPADETLPCAHPPAPPVSATDACDPNPTVLVDDVIEESPCVHAYRVVRTWTAIDACLNESSAQQVLTVVDDGPPTLHGVPADVTLPCAPEDAVVTASDGCDASPDLRFEVSRVDGRCPGTYQLLRHWEAEDDCGAIASADQVVSVEDVHPPEVTGSTANLACLWPPNHRMVTLTAAELHVDVADGCGGPVTWRIADCTSSQPEDDLGDGHFEPDCIVASDGQSIAVRAERQGMGREGRRYGIRIVAEDECGNASAPTLIGYVHVPRDSRATSRCRH